MNARILIVILLLMCIGIISCGDEDTPTIPEPKTGNLDGRVYWGNWFGISGARVCLINYECDVTDERAWYVFEDIPEGTYSITAYAPGYEIYYGSVRIYPNNDNYRSIELVPEPSFE